MNAREELLELVRNKTIKCATITHGNGFIQDVNETFDLLIDYTTEEYNDFLTKLDFTYDAGYGSQELFGYVWFIDGTWAERHEYDGSEYWMFKQTPLIPLNLIRSQKLDVMNEKNTKNRHEVTPQLLDIGLRLVGLHFDIDSIGKIIDVVELLKRKGREATIDDTFEIEYKWKNK